MGKREERPGRIRVAVVDDEPLIGELVREFLSPANYHVEIFLRPREALKALSTETYEIIFCDMRMPDLHGTELYTILKSVRPDLAERFVFLTGDLMCPLIEHFFAVEACPHLNKPFTSAQIKITAASFSEKFGLFQKAA